MGVIPLRTLEGECGVAMDNTGYCFGGNNSYERGDGTTTSPPYEAVTAVAGGAIWRQIAAGISSNRETRCGTTTVGVALCWGSNLDGAVSADRSPRLVAIPTPVKTSRRFLAVGVRCGLGVDAAFYCWGDGYSDSRSTDVATNVGGSLRFTAFETSSLCALTTGGAVYCLDGVGSVRRVGPSFPVKAFTVGAGVACGIALDGITYCWGDNGNGSLGRGDNVQTGDVVRVAGQ